jgi:hypothetical protein
LRDSRSTSAGSRRKRTSAARIAVVCKKKERQREELAKRMNSVLSLGMDRKAFEDLHIHCQGKWIK